MMKTLKKEIKKMNSFSIFNTDREKVIEVVSPEENVSYAVCNAFLRIGGYVDKYYVLIVSRDGFHIQHIVGVYSNNERACKDCFRLVRTLKAATRGRKISRWFPTCADLSVAVTLIKGFEVDSEWLLDT